jgi:hypothetical protein
MEMQWLLLLCALSACDAPVAHLDIESGVRLAWNSPAPGFQVARFAANVGGERFNGAGGFAWTSLDSIYNEVQGSLQAAFAPVPGFPYWALGLRYQGLAAWVPGEAEWQGHQLELESSFNFHGVFASGRAGFDGAWFGKAFLGYEHKGYSAILEIPILHPQNAPGEDYAAFLSGCVKVGSLELGQLVAWPGPGLGFLVRVAVGRLRVSAAHLRGGAPEGQTEMGIEWVL